MAQAVDEIEICCIGIRVANPSDLIELSGPRSYSQVETMYSLTQFEASVLRIISSI